MAEHNVTVEKVLGAPTVHAKSRWGWRWTCRTCRERGEWVEQKRLALKGAAQHAAGNSVARPV